MRKSLLIDLVLKTTHTKMALTDWGLSEEMVEDGQLLFNDVSSYAIKKVRLCEVMSLSVQSFI